MNIRLFIEAAPRTKKTSNRVQRFGKFNKVVPSEAWIEFRDRAVPQLRRQFHGAREIDRPVQVNAQVYRDAKRGDLVGYLTSIADVLEEAGIVSNDVVIESWDGSRMRVDRQRPRVEILISPLDINSEDIDG